MNKALIYCILIFIATQFVVWFQTNGQFISSWYKNNTFLVSLIGIPISYGYIYATKYGYEAFDGSLWSTRLLGFALGTISFAIMTYSIMGEGLNYKTLVSILLAISLVLIQLFWK
jgi:hypothetical protein|tara:strand:+ start:293 stop:637 length:345 start_codon:yes stop_codon:yes gene_type:complete